MRREQISTAVGDLPHLARRSNYLLFHPYYKRLFVTSFNKSSLHIIDTTTNTILKKIPIYKLPYNITLTPHNKKLYITC